MSDFTIEPSKEAVEAAIREIKAAGREEVFVRRALAAALPIERERWEKGLLSDEVLEGVCSEIPGLGAGNREDVDDLRRGLEAALATLAEEDSDE